jgi:hypothetical protein
MSFDPTQVTKGQEQRLGQKPTKPRGNMARQSSKRACSQARQDWVLFFPNNQNIQNNRNFIVHQQNAV